MCTREPNQICASCVHCSLDGRFCHNWHRPTELEGTCPQFFAVSKEVRTTLEKARKRYEKLGGKK